MEGFKEDNKYYHKLSPLLMAKFSKLFTYFNNIIPYRPGVDMMTRFRLVSVGFDIKCYRCMDFSKDFDTDIWL